MHTIVRRKWCNATLADPQHAPYAIASTLYRVLLRYNIASPAPTLTSPSHRFDLYIQWPQPQAIASARCLPPLSRASHVPSRQDPREDAGGVPSALTQLTSRVAASTCALMSALLMMACREVRCSAVAQLLSRCSAAQLLSRCSAGAGWLTSGRGGGGHRTYWAAPGLRSGPGAR